MLSLEKLVALGYARGVENYIYGVLSLASARKICEIECRLLNRGIIATVVSHSEPTTKHIPQARLCSEELSSTWIRPSTPYQIRKSNQMERKFTPSSSSFQSIGVPSEDITLNCAESIVIANVA